LKHITLHPSLACSLQASAQSNGRRAAGWLFSTGKYYKGGVRAASTDADAGQVGPIFNASSRSGTHTDNHVAVLRTYYSPTAGVQEATSSGYYTDAFILARIRQPLLLPGCPNLCSDLPLLASACRPEARVVVVVARTNSINNSALAAPPASRPSWLLPAGDLVSSIRLLSWSPGACVRACPSLGLEPPKGFLEQIDEFQCQGLTCTDTHG
jgi:hypothetical protein